jgi:hypothetical protein
MRARVCLCMRERICIHARDVSENACVRERERERERESARMHLQTRALSFILSHKHTHAKLGSLTHAHTGLSDTHTKVSLVRTQIKGINTNERHTNYRHLKHC